MVHLPVGILLLVLEAISASRVRTTSQHRPSAVGNATTYNSQEQRPVVEIFFFPSACYIFDCRRQKWTENREACKEWGAGSDLVSMETEDEWDRINKKVQHSSACSIDETEWHIGLTKIGQNWKWVSGASLDIEKWQDGQPSGDGPFVVMSKNYPACSKGHFNDLPDRIERPSICELPRGLPTCPSNVAADAK